MDDSSGDLFLAFSTANEGNNISPQAAAQDKVARLTSASLRPLFQATAQAAEEAVDNSTIAARTMTGANYLTIPGLPHAKLQWVPSKHHIPSTTPK